MAIEFKVNSAEVARSLAADAKQIRFATVLAVNDLAKRVQDAETAALPRVLDRPTPFTMRAFGTKGATKQTMQAEVFAKQTQAKYLAPSEFGGQQVLGNARRIRTPVDAKLNAYGNLPKGFIARKIAGGALSTPGKRGFFIGVVKGVNGLWQRVPGTKTTPPSLKLLVAFTKPVEVKPKLGFAQRALQVVRDNAAPAFADALRRALKSAR